jgi:signal transduction histidine kinase
MPAIPVAGFVLEALGAVALALMLSSLQRERSRAGVRDWSLGLWCLAAALLASIAVGELAESSPLKTPVLALAVVLAYWTPALLLLGTWSRWNDRDLPRLRRGMLLGLVALGCVGTFAAPLAGTWAQLVRAGTRSGLTLAAYQWASVLLLRGQRQGAIFGARVLALAFLGMATEEGLFLGLLVTGGERATVAPSPELLIEAELLLLMLAGVGMVAWLLEEERESAIRLQDALLRKEAFSVMGTLVAGVAHQVRNPLFGITATVDALGVRLGRDASAAPLFEAMREQVGRLGGLMNDLLDYGRPIASELTPHSAFAVVARAVESCAALARQADVVVELSGEDSSAIVVADGARLLQAFQNLVENAIEHTPRGGMVRVDARLESRLGRSGVLCSVRDRGPGFDPADLPRVFEPFFTRRPGGTGLGLPIVQRIVEQHAGQVEAANHPEGGGLVSVWLPAGPARR